MQERMLRIKSLREAKDLPQNYLAWALGVTPGAVAAWECGRTMPSAKLLPRIAELLDCKIDDLYTSAPREPRTADELLREAKQVG